MINPTATELARWRLRTDTLADDTISALYAEHALDAVNQVLAELVLNDHICPDTLPAAVRHFLFLSGRLPAWADPQQLALGQRVFAERGPLILLSLVTCSLAECYALGNGVEVLHLTHRMDDRHVYRRIYETAQFIIDVCQSGGLAPDGRGLRAIQKVRLMHASIRHLILTEGPTDHDHQARGFSDVLLGTTWDSARLGLPLCYEDQAYTQLSFSWVTLRSLERFGSPCTAAESAAWMHLWAVIGHLIGLPDALLAHTAEDGARLYAGIRAHQTRGTPAGRQLTAALGTFVAEKLDSPFLGRHLTAILLRWLCDDHTLRQVGVRPLTADERLVMGALRHVTGWLWRDPQDWLHERLGTALVERLTKLPREWRRGLFAIPDSLLTAWAAAAITKDSARKSAALNRSP